MGERHASPRRRHDNVEQRDVDKIDHILSPLYLSRSVAVCRSYSRKIDFSGPLKSLK